MSITDVKYATQFGISGTWSKSVDAADTEDVGFQDGTLQDANEVDGPIWQNYTAPIHTEDRYIQVMFGAYWY